MHFYFTNSLFKTWNILGIVKRVQYKISYTYRVVHENIVPIYKNRLLDWFK